VLASICPSYVKGEAQCSALPHEKYLFSKAINNSMQGWQNLGDCINLDPPLLSGRPGPTTFKF